MRTRFEPVWVGAVLALACNIDGGQSGTDGLEVDQSNPPAEDDDVDTTPVEPEPAPSDASGALPDAGAPTEPEPAGPRENLDTDWLGFCGSGCEPGLSCVCGVCTVACEATAECTELHARAQCQPPQPSDPMGCYRAVNTSVCELGCSSNEDCRDLSDLHVCDRGRCRGPSLGWMQSLCEEPPALEVPQCDVDEQLRPLDYCGILECAAVSPQCDWNGEGAVIDCATEPVVRWNTTLGRCEHVEACSSGSFTTIEKCWEGCEATNYGMCLEDWQPLEGEQAAGINGITAAAVVSALQRSFSAEVRYPDGTESVIHLELSDMSVFELIAIPNPNFTLDIVPSCFTTQVVEANARFYTDDGQFDETWQRLRLDTTVPELITFQVQVMVPGSEGNPIHTPSLVGSYAPTEDPARCLIGTAISGTISGDVFTGEVFHTLSTVPCGDPNGAVTSGPGDVPPNGPVW